MGGKINMDIEELKLEVGELKASMEADSPDMRNYLLRIHKNLLTYPELTYLLQPSDRATIVAGLCKIQGIQLETKAAKPKSKTAMLKALSSVEDL
jgi:hypothetical protein